MIDYSQRFKTPEECAEEVRRHYRARLAEFIGCCAFFAGLAAWVFMMFAM